MREANKGGANGAGSVGGSGVTGLKSLGVRDLQYKTAFLACMVHDSDGRVSSRLVLINWPRLNRSRALSTFEAKSKREWTMETLSHTHSRTLNSPS